MRELEVNNCPFIVKYRNAYGRLNFIKIHLQASVHWAI